MVERMLEAAPRFHRVPVQLSELQAFREKHVAGLALGHALLGSFLDLLLGDAGGTVRVPRSIIALTYGVAIWGALMVLAGILRILQATLRQYAHAASFVIVPVLGTALGVLGLMVSFGVWPAK